MKMSYNTFPKNPFPPNSEEYDGNGGGQYVLPTASADTLGGVKVGSNLSIADGVLSAPAPYSLPTASDETLGGVKVGSGLSIEDGVLSVSGGGGGYNHNFSTEEQIVGKWIDGRDLFERTYVVYADNEWKVQFDGTNILLGLTGCDMILVDRFYMERVDGVNHYWYSVTGDTITTLVPNTYRGSVYYAITWNNITYLAFTLRYVKTPVEP